MNTQSIKKFFFIVFFVLTVIRLIPHLLVFNVCRKKEFIIQDLKRWLKLCKPEKLQMDEDTNIQLALLYFMTFFPEYRNLFYNRIGFVHYFLRYLCRPMKFLFLDTEDIGPGFFIQHGYSTAIAAKSIGKNCFVNHEITLGYSENKGQPVIGDNVFIHTGARVIGDIVIGNNCRIGTNAVVVKSVPDNCTVVGVPAYIVKRDGVRVREELK